MAGKKEKQYVSDNAQLMAEWDWERNKDIDPHMLTIGSGKKVWWHCNRGHIWQAAIYSRSGGTGCPVCANKIVLIGENDLTTLNPSLAEEWNYSKNGALAPSMVTPSSGKKVWWICHKGHEWKSSVDARNHGRGCPICAPAIGGKRHSENWVAQKGSLATICPALAVQWHPTKNGSLTPADVACNTKQKVWWKCDLGHEWEASISNRFRGRACPYCSNKKVLRGFNDLKSQFPELMAEWNFRKNTINPENVSFGSDYTVWWICPKGHEWQTNIYFRTHNHCGCPECAKEDQTSFPEQVILYYCSKIFKNVHSRHRVNGCELDIYIKDIAVGIEYDGYFFHNSASAQKSEENKNMRISDAGIRLLRIKETGTSADARFENDIFYLPRKYGDTILAATVEKLFALLGICIERDFVDIERDRSEILNNYIANEKRRSITDLYPQLVEEWNYKRNGMLTPEMFAATSHKKVWWKCANGHEWEAMIANRTDKKRGCPYCSNQKILAGYNDLATRNPTLANEWHPIKNGTLTPNQVFPFSNKRVWWLCKKGHEWQAVVYSRSNGSGCPECAKKRKNHEQD